MILAYPGGFVDVLLDFDVKVTDPAFQISGVSMSFIGSAMPGNGLAQIVETVYGGSDQPTLLQVSTLDTNTATAPLSPTPTPRSMSPKTFLRSGRRRSIRSLEAVSWLPASHRRRRSTSSPSCSSRLPNRLRHRSSSLVLWLCCVVVLCVQLSTLAIVIGLGLTGMLMQPSTASAVPLDTLDGTANTLTYGDFTFSNFDFNVVGSVGSTFVDTVGDRRSGLHHS